MSLPLAFNQERHLVAEEAMALGGYVPTGARVPLAFRINADLDRRRIERALNGVIQRHAALRNTYGPNGRYSHDERLMQLRLYARTGVFVPGLYVQRVPSDVYLTVHETTLADEDEVTALLRKELATPLDTTSGLPIRATLASAGPAGRWLLLVLTHQTMDGWSVGVFAREFVAVVENAASDTSSLPAVPIQYHDFAAWQLHQFRQGHFSREECFWHEQWSRLGDASIAFRDLPFRRRSPAAMVTMAFSSYERLRFTAEESAPTYALIAQLKLTPYVLFRTAITIALHHLTRKRRLAFWGNFTNRRYPEFVPALGWYSNTHIVCVELEPEMMCALLCRRVAASVAEARAHEALPLAALWQRLGCSLDTHNTRVNFDLLPGRKRPERQPAIELVVLPVGPRNMDLDIRLREDCGVFVLVATFNAERYQIAGVQRLLASIRSIVMAMTEGHDLRVSDCRRFVSPEDDAQAPTGCGSRCATCENPADEVLTSAAVSSVVV